MHQRSNKNVFETTSAPTQSGTEGATPKAFRKDTFPTGKRCHLVLHQDDVGMSHGANLAFKELHALGTCSSGSVMVPCPWFLEAAEIAAGLPQSDLGVHLTLTSEKRLYRWGPVTHNGPSSGLTDEWGYFWPDVTQLRNHAEPAAVECELRGQIDLAYQAGIDVTHLDAHMGAVLAPEFREIYLKLGQEYGLPILLTHQFAQYGPKHNLGDLGSDDFGAFANRASRLGMVPFDQVLETVWSCLPDRAETYRDLISEAVGPRTFFSLHFNAPGDIEAIDSEDHAEARIAEFQLFGSEEFRSWLTTLDIEIEGFRGLREELRRKI